MSATSTNGLTAEQLKRMEENRLKALQKRSERAAAASPHFPSSNSVSSLLPPVKSKISNGVEAFKDKQRNGTNPNVQGVKKSVNSPKIAMRGACVIISRERFRVDIGFHEQLINIFKTLSSKMYDPMDRKWNFLISQHDELMKAILPLKSDVTIVGLSSNTLKLYRQMAPVFEQPEVDLSCLEPTLHDALLPFQKIGVSYGIAHNGRVLIADDMGLGKTIQALAIADAYRTEWPLLVVCPSSMRYSWKEAFRVWLPSLDEQDVIVLNNSKEHLGRYKVYITSYDLMSRRAAELESKAFRVVIFDESHHLKSHKAARTKAAKDIISCSKRIILLSGTPALSKPVELYTQISMINSTLFPNFQEFGLRYCDGKKNNWGWDYNGASNSTELLLIMEEKVMIRRLKVDVMKQLPPKVRQMVILDPSEIGVNRKAMKHCSDMLANKSVQGMERRGILLNYYHETSQCKAKAVCNYIVELIEKKEKFLCFAHHQIMMDSICDMLQAKKVQYIRIDGSTPPALRKQHVDTFQFQDCLVAVLSVTAANTGLTLTAAKLVVFAELFWNPGILTQAEDRVHRIGQEDSVLIQYLVAKGTADDELWMLIRKKLDVLGKFGLSKDNFLEADTKMLGKQNSLLNFFEVMEDFDSEFPESVESPVKKVKTV